MPRYTKYSETDPRYAMSYMEEGGTKKDACYKKAKAKYSVFPSAYASGYIAKCRKRRGNIN